MYCMAHSLVKTGSVKNKYTSFHKFSYVQSSQMFTKNPCTVRFFKKRYFFQQSTIINMIWWEVKCWSPIIQKIEFSHTCLMKELAGNVRLHAIIQSLVKLNYDIQNICFILITCRILFQLISFRSYPNTSHLMFIRYYCTWIHNFDFGIRCIL